jgi:polar amino acid transport system substrate-binding protein
MSHTSLLRHSLLMLSALFVTALMACSSGNDSTKASGETTLDRIRREGKIRIGYANEAPYAYRDTASGRVTGEAPEIARQLLGSLGVTEVEGVLTEFGSLIPGLKAGRFDVIAAGMYIQPERCREVVFSNPTYGIGEALIVKAGNPKGIHSYEDIAAHKDATLGVVAGAVERGYARTLGIPDDRVITFPDAPSAAAGVRAGRVDAYGGTSLTVQDILDKLKVSDIERAEPFTDPVIEGATVRGFGAFAFRKEDGALLAAFNDGLAGFIGSEAHLDLVRPFGFTEADLPGSVTAAELCRAEK